jgi:hypothetical protein
MTKMPPNLNPTILLHLHLHLHLHLQMTTRKLLLLQH